MLIFVYFDQKFYFKMPLSNISKKYRKLIILLAAVKLEPYIILGKFFICEYISTSTPTYLKMKKFHGINFLDVFDSYRNGLLSWYVVPRLI